ncbi:MAG: DMT family transporter [Rhodospirillales bacterium]|nr:DMT family transporter [Rhodospirillales bacterium]
MENQEPQSVPRPAPAFTDAIPDTVKGIILMVSAMLIIPFNDGIAKALTARYPATEIAWGRYFFHFLILVPLIAWKHGPMALKPERAFLHLLRGAFTVCATIFFFLGLSRLPMADTLALVFGYPLMVTAMSPFFLGEKVGIRRWMAVLAGLVGTLIIIRPGTDLFQWSSLLGVMAGLCMASYWVVTRRISGSAPPLVAAAYAALFGTLVLPVLIPTGWVMPTLPDIGLLAAMGGIAAVFHLLVVRALAYAAASVLAPFGYCEMIMATTIGYLVFGDFPDALTWMGIFIVIGAGIYVSWRERKTEPTA